MAKERQPKAERDHERRHVSGNKGFGVKAQKRGQVGAQKWDERSPNNSTNEQ